MKNIIVLLLLITIGCNQSPIEKPEVLIAEETMIEILYDVALIQASKGHKPRVIDSSINVNTFIFEKYKIDSITFSQNQKFYAANAKEFKKMYEKVTEKIKVQEIIADSLSKNEKKEIKEPILKTSVNPKLE
jgi:hypothetical protein